jgi:hypothetical protein
MHQRVKKNELTPKILANGTPEKFSLPIDPIAATLLVRQVQDAVDSSNCHVLGTNLWILIRNEIYYSISREVGSFFDAMIGKPGFSGRVYSGQPLAVPQTFRLMEGAKRSALICGDGRRAEDLKGGVIFCEVPADYTQFIDGFAVNCFADSMIELMRKHESVTGALTKLCRLQPRMATVQKLVDPSYFFHNSSAELSKNINALKAFRNTVFEVNRFFYKNNIQIVIDSAKLEQQVREIVSYRSAFVDIFEELEPRMVFVQNFSNIEKFGALFAARDLGVKTVDIQHGIQEHTSMYNCHPAHCADGTYLYPDVLWCWGGISRDALVKEQSKRPVPWKTAMEGGYPWKQLVRDMSSTIRLAKLRERLPKDRRIALYCHDPALINSQRVIGLLPGEIFDAIQNSKPDIFWLVRFHPRALHLLKDFGDFCAVHDITNVEFELSSMMPIEQVLDAADVLLTKFSVSALEAMSVGVPVVSHSWIGEVTFDAYRDHPLLSFASEPQDIISHVKKARRADPKHAGRRTDKPFNYVNADTKHSEQAFLSLLGA